MKRTKRYGGFLVGDRVKAKGYDKLNGEVIGFLNGYLKCVFDEITPRVPVVFAPNQLINLTRIEEENRKITDELPPISEETAKKHEERFNAFCGKHNITPPKVNFNPAKEIDELKVIKDFVAEALRQTELFLSPLTPYGDPLPSPYTRDVYTSTKDYVLQHKK